MELFEEDRSTASFQPKIFPNFPHDEHIHDQIIYVLNAIGKATRKPGLEKEYKKHSGSDKPINFSIRKMKEAGKLVTAKFNNSWAQTFYGLPEWVEEDKFNIKLFKEENEPSKKDLPNGLSTLEWLK